MKIKFPKFRLYLHLTLGILWIVLGSFALYSKDFSRWYDYLFVGLGIMYLGHFYYDKTHHYLIIENATITKNILYGFKNKIELDQIHEIQKVKGNYILTSETQKMKINLDLVDESSLNNLIEVLGHLNLPSEKSFLTHQK